MEDNLASFMKRAVQNIVESITAEELEEAKKRIEKRKAEAIASVILYVEDYVSIQTLGNELIITVRKEPSKQ